MIQRLILTLTLLSAALLGHAESRVKINVDCPSPGTLSSLITYVDRQKVTDLYVSGYINKADFQFINEVAAIGNLKVLDCSQATSIDGYMPLYYRIPVLSEDGNTILYYKKLDRISFPKCETFSSSMNADTYVDTIQINGRCIKEFKGWHDIEEIILGEGVEEIGEKALVGCGDYKKGEGYLINKFPNSLKIISNSAFFHAAHYYGVSNTSRIINPEISLPEYIVQIGADKNSDKYDSYTFGAWMDTKFKVRRNTVTFPQTLRVFNGMNIIRSDYVPMTEFECDTLILHKGMEYFSAGVNSKVMISEMTEANNIKWDKVYTDKLYVPKTAFDNYERELSWDADINNKHIKEILPIINVTGVTISLSKSIYTGETVQLQYVLSPVDALNRNIIWKSSDESIATVNGLGLLKAIKAGHVTITATTDNGTVGVLETDILQHAFGIEITPNEATIKNGESMQLQCAFKPADTSNKNLKWSSSSPNVCHVSSKGVVTALSTGVCVITAESEDGNYTSECKVTVVQPASSVTLTPKNIELRAGENYVLHAEIEPATTSDKTLTWSSTDETVVKVDGRGQITAISGGKARIYATSNSDTNISDFCEVTVTQPLVGISFSETEIEVFKDDWVQLNVVFTPDNATNKTIKWTSSDVNIALVSGNGMVYGINEGTCSIIATSEDGNYIAICRAKVVNKNVPVESINFDKTQIIGKVSDKIKIEVTILPDNASNKTLSWSTTNEAIASVDNNGLVQLKKSGTATISAKATDGSNVSTQCEVVVSENSGIESIVVDQSSHVKIYDLNGYIIYEGLFSDANLESGIYIVKCNGTSAKIKITK